jgi:hypothetical protein
MWGGELSAATDGISWGALCLMRAYSNEAIFRPSHGGVVENVWKVEGLNRVNRRRENRKKGGCSLS